MYKGWSFFFLQLKSLSDISSTSMIMDKKVAIYKVFKLHTCKGLTRQNVDTFLYKHLKIFVPIVWAFMAK